MAGVVEPAMRRRQCPCQAFASEDPGPHRLYPCEERLQTDHGPILANDIEARRWPQRTLPSSRIRTPARRR